MGDPEYKEVELGSGVAEEGCRDGSEVDGGHDTMAGGVGDCCMGCRGVM